MKDAMDEFNANYLSLRHPHEYNDAVLKQLDVTVNALQMLYDRLSDENQRILLNFMNDLTHAVEQMLAKT